MAISATQIKNCLNKFKETEEKGTFKCELRPARYDHDRWMEILKEARVKEEISAYWASLIDGEGTYYYKF